MARKVLCPACGTINHPGYRLAARCSHCRKRLPFTWPRGITYTLRTLLRPILVLILLATAIIAAPHFKTYRQNLVIEKSYPTK